jgi:pyruvate/2-oxoglutarate dehydrogenase complex dihydrolipoamide dehydrogenase (E3) component
MRFMAFDAIVIGTGFGGTIAAVQLAQLTSNSQTEEAAEKGSSGSLPGGRG